MVNYCFQQAAGDNFAADTPESLDQEVALISSNIVFKGKGNLVFWSYAQGLCGFCATDYCDLWIYW
jgi:hypothetical protein